MTLPILAAIVLLAGIAACIQSLAGFGSSLFIVPLLAVLIGPRHAVFLANLISAAVSLIQVVHLRRAVEWRTQSLLLAGSCVGMPLGLVVLLVLSPTVLQVLIALTVVVFTLVLMRGVRLHDAGRIGDLATGLVSGVLNTSTSMSGPPVVLYLQGKGMPPLAFRATATAFFLVTSVIAVVLLLAGGAFQPWLFGAAALAMPAVVGGRLLGNWIFRHVEDVHFRKIVFGVLLATSGVAVATALLG